MAWLHIRLPSTSRIHNPMFGLKIRRSASYILCCPVQELLPYSWVLHQDLDARCTQLCPQACRAHQITDLHNLSNLICEIAEKKLYNNTLKVTFKSAWIELIDQQTIRLLRVQNQQHTVNTKDVPQPKETQKKLKSGLNNGETHWYVRSKAKCRDPVCFSSYALLSGLKSTE